MTQINHNLGLSLSGAGFRAAAFHLGALSKLHELELLKKVDTISAISGAAIIGAQYCSSDQSFESFKKDMYTGLQKHNGIKDIFMSAMFLKTVLFVLIFLGSSIAVLFTAFAWVSPLMLILMGFLFYKFQFRIFPVSQRTEQLYDQYFYKGKTLSDLRAKPVLVVGSTNLETGRPFIFSRTVMQDSTYQYRRDNDDDRDPIHFIAGKFPIARAVMASSAMPVAFSPIKIAKEYFKDEMDYQRINPLLVDGAVCDNYGMHKILQQGGYACKTVISCDSGNRLSKNRRSKNSLELAIRCLDIYESTAIANKEVAFISLNWEVESCIERFIENLANGNISEPVINALEIKEEWVKHPAVFESEIIFHLKIITGYEKISKPTPEELEIARSVSTNLKSLSKLQIDCLMKQAAALTELQVKLYAPSILKQENTLLHLEKYSVKFQ